MLLHLVVLYKNTLNTISKSNITEIKYNTSKNNYKIKLV